MWSAIQKQFRVQWGEGAACSVILIAAGLFGTALMCTVLSVSGENETYFEIGTLIAGIVFAMWSLVGTGLNFYSSFQIEVGMGSTRKHFFVSFYLCGLVQSLINVLLLGLVYLLEHNLYRILYPGMASEVEMGPGTAGVGIFLAIVLPMVGVGAAALMMRFGKIAFWIMWAIWMAGFLLVPRLLGAAEDHPESVYGILGKGIMGLTGIFSLPVWLGIIFAASVLLFLGSYRIIRRQQVTA